MTTEAKSLRGWQASALPAIFGHIDDRPLVRAVMGAGKSVLIAELVKHVPDTLNIIITTPNIRLVDDLADTLHKWAGIEAGKFYSHASDIERVTVVCNDSLPAFAAARCEDEPLELWICDEAHRSECSSVKDSIAQLDPYRRVGFTATPFRASEGESLSQFDTLAFNYTATQAIQDGVVVIPRVKHYQGRKGMTLNEACGSAIASAKGPGLANAGNIEDAREFAEYLGHEWDVRAYAIHSKLKPEEEARRIALLEHGEIDALVHVNMLAEGVNLPWLRWLCCRRPVGSPVRFAQEVGRVLRAHPGKSHAVIYDPHDLFGAFQLDNEAVLSGGGDPRHKDPLKLPALHLDFLCEQIRLDEEPPETYRGVPVPLIDPISSYLRKLALQLQFANILEPEIQSTHWRREPPSVGQVKYVRSLRKKPLPINTPEEHAKALNIAAAAAPGLRKGDVSDLISILVTLNDIKRWPDYIDVSTTRMKGAA